MPTLASILNMASTASSGNWEGLVEAARPGTEANAIRAGLGKLTGVEPRIYDTGNRWVVMYDDAGAAQVRAWIDSKVFGTAKGEEGAASVRAQTPSSVRTTETKLGNVISSYLLYRAVPVAVGLVALGYWIGSTKAPKSRRKDSF